MKQKEKHFRLFNRIAPIYGFFYTMQKRKYRKVIDKVKADFDIRRFNSVIDVGCGTGAMCQVLKDYGLEVTGIDAAQRMIDVAKKKTKDQSIHWVQGDILEDDLLKENGFDIAFASYVAHGLSKENRMKLYAKMQTLAKEYVIFHDYNNNRNFLTSVIEWAEGGDYFYFIEHAEQEMRACIHDMKSCFKSVDVIHVGARSNWYICKV